MLPGDASLSQPRTSWQRWLYRLPLQLRRAGIRGYERLLGIEWIAVTTRGRRSGRPHEVMLDEIGRDEASDTWYVSPANGRRSEWVRNVLADPQVTIEVSGRRVQARARDASGDEGAEVFLRFVREHPRYARLVARLGAFADMSAASDADARAYFREAVVIALTAAGDRDPTRPPRS